MITKTSHSYPVSIYIAGNYAEAHEICQRFCDQRGLCVTVTPLAYVYTGGDEAGVRVGLINYPRFPKSPQDIWDTAYDLAAELRVLLNQQSFTLEAPDKTRWYSWREADQP